MRRPSFPTVISLIALFIALGGTSYAVVKLPRNSVGNAQIKRSAVTTSKIRNGTIGPADLNPSAAGRRGPRGPAGPAGAAGTSGTGLNPAPEPWKVLPFVGAWTNYANGFDSAAFRKDQLGKVHLRGLVTKNGGLPVGSEVIATLPAGYRPTAELVFPISSGGPTDLYGRIDVKTSGDVVIILGGSGETDFASLATISFWTD